MCTPDSEREAQMTQTYWMDVRHVVRRIYRDNISLASECRVRSSQVGVVCLSGCGLPKWVCDSVQVCVSMCTWSCCLTREMESFDMTISFIATDSKMHM